MRILETFHSPLCFTCEKAEVHRVAEVLSSSFQQNEPPAFLCGWGWSQTIFLLPHQRPPANKCHAEGSVPTPGTVSLTGNLLPFHGIKRLNNATADHVGEAPGLTVLHLWYRKCMENLYSKGRICWGLVSAAGEWVAGVCWDSVELQLLGHRTDSAYVCYWCCQAEQWTHMACGSESSCSMYSSPTLGQGNWWDTQLWRHWNVHWRHLQLSESTQPWTVGF